MNSVNIEVVDLSSDTESEDGNGYGVTDDELTDSDSTGSSLDTDTAAINWSLVPGGLNPEEYMILKRRFNLKEFSVIVNRLPPSSIDDYSSVQDGPVKVPRKRRKKSEPSNYIHECSFQDCHIKFDSEECRDAHYKRKHEGIKKPYNCSKCGSCFSFPSHLASHEKTHDGTISFECPECSEKFGTSWSLNKHRDRVHNAGRHATLCEHCGKSLSGKSGYRRHIRLHLPHLAIPCDICGKKFTSRRDMKRHHVRHDPVTSTQLREKAKCQYCNKVFSSKSYLQLHERKHTGQLELSCDICGYRTAIPSILKVHMLSHSDIREFNCDSCSYACKTVTRLNDHKRTVHSETRNFLCTYCGMAFKNKNNWLGHEEIHKNNENAILCTICGRGFKVRRYLISHFRHSHKYFGKIPDDVSQITPETVAESANPEESADGQEQGRKVEGDIRNYICSFCGKTFKYKNNWVSHELLHTNDDETFSCALCDRGFKVKRYLTYHLRNAHKIHGKIPENKVELVQLAGSLKAQETSITDEPRSREISTKLLLLFPLLKLKVSDLGSYR
ncbi:unnamed protein product [Allacma fusca]|uniref:C2H2-type domain-containing protein n=1 Tax=Allacma fusca TaxID=39272 RepID=A0A8J2NS86_9HEXA|nr:unnamed protein product [Allacma fusca]